MDADTCGDETSMHLEGPQSLVNIAHIGKVNFCLWNVKLHSMF